MPLFLTEEEFRQCAHDPSLVAEKADEAILNLRRQLDTVRAEADAASITAEQTYNVLEQRYASVSAELVRVQAESARLTTAAEGKLAETAEALAAKHELHLKTIEKDGEIERLKVEVSELQKSNRQLLQLLRQKDTEIGEKNAVIQSYLDKIVKLTENATMKESRLQESEAELNRSRAACARLVQEKELLEKHNTWLNEELTDKENRAIELRKTYNDLEADMSAKLAETERKVNEYSRTLKQNEDRVKEYEMRVASLEEELSLCKSSAAAVEQRYSAELSTASKLAELYKESSDEWSKKAGELEGVIKALETHLRQVENDYKVKLADELSAKKAFEKEAMDAKEKLGKCEIELENARKASEQSLLLESSIHDGPRIDEISTDVREHDLQNADTRLILKKPVGISGTALAASLLRDGWSLAKMYEKYQEAADALMHERRARRHSEAVLERVLHEVEEKVELILEERVEHQKMVEAYTSLNQKLQRAQSEHDAYESSIRNLKAELKRQERDYAIAQKEIFDLQRQVTVLLKECRDVQIRCGVASSEPFMSNSGGIDEGSDASQLTFKDINELVQQNGQLRTLVQSLSSVEETRLSELKERFEMELEKQNNEAVAKVEAVLGRCEEQAQMIESLHSAVAMYKRLYEEEQKLRSSGSISTELRGASHVSAEGKKLEGSQLVQEAANRNHKELVQRAGCLEQDLAHLRNELMTVQVDRDKSSMEAKYTRGKLDSFMKEFERQRSEANGILARNVELTQLMVDYERRLRESNDSLHDSEERFRKLSVEVSILKNEKEVLINSEKRAADEIQCLSERVYRLQSSLDTIQSMEDLREESRSTERRKLEEYANRIEKEWAEAKKELQEERDHVRCLTAEREKAIEDSKREVEQMRKELSDAWHAVSSAESRAAVMEERCSNLETLMKSHDKTTDNDKENDGSSLASNEEEMEKLKEEAQAYKSYMIQYKEIAHTNEVVAKQMESALAQFMSEAAKSKANLESEIQTLSERVIELENECMLKSNEVLSASIAKEDAATFAAKELERMKEDNSIKIAKVLELENQICLLKGDLEREHERWRTTQSNYERQVILQSETIQEMTKTSKDLASLQNEASELRKSLDAFKAENELLKSSWQTEKTSLVEAKEDAEKKYKEIDEQNKILHKRLEALHLKYSEEQSSGSRSTGLDAHGDSDLHSVISHLRRRKEIAETEVSLLKQEKVRLQSQLEMASKSYERAQSLLQSEREKARNTLYTEEEFNSLKHQVREINLLRESNAQLREDNKHNFEECQKLREMIQNAKIESEQQAREKDNTIDGLQKEIEMLKAEKGKLEHEATKLQEKINRFDITDVERIKVELQQSQIKLKEREAEVDTKKSLLAEKQEESAVLQEKLLKCQRELDEQQKKMSALSQIEVNLKSDLDRQKKIAASLKKKIELLMKEKEYMSKENQSLKKQMEDSLGKRTSTEGPGIESDKEKDTRIQILERTLEREREYSRKEKNDLKREKATRFKNEKAFLCHFQRIHQEKKKVEDEISIHKRYVRIALESFGITATQIPSMSSLERQCHAYFFAVEKYEEEADTVRGDGLGASSLPAESSLSEATIGVTGQQASRALVKPASHQVQLTEQKEKGPAKLNTDARKPGRKIVRPRLEQSEEPTIDAEMSEMEGTTVAQAKPSESHDEEPHVNFALPSFSRKRALEIKEDSAQHESDSGVKKSKGLESPGESAEKQAILHDGSVSSPTEDTLGSGAVQHAALSGEDTGGVEKDEKLDDAGAELKEQLDEPKEVVNQDLEVKTEGDSFPRSPEKPEEGAELLDELLKGDEGEGQHQPSILGEDDMEEGEMAPDESDLQPYDVESGELEPTSGDAGNVAVETDETLDTMSIPVLNEGKIDDNSIIDDVQDTDKSNNEQPSLDYEEGQLTSSGTHPDSADVQVDVAAPEQGSSSLVLETGESQSAPVQSETSDPQVATAPRRISIAERARQNALVRQAGMTPPAGTVPRGQNRGGRGRGVVRNAGRRGRGGRSQNLSE